MIDEQKLPPRILCVDDHKALCETLKAVLGKLPARVDAVYDAESALDRLTDPREQSDPYRLVILDVFLPLAEGTNANKPLGLELFMDLQKSYQLLALGTPTVVFTQYPSFDHCVASIRAGAVDYIPKRDQDTKKNNVELLYQRCKALLYPPQAPSDPLPQWLDEHVDELMEKHGGGWVGIIDEHLAKEAGLPDPPLGGFVLLPGETFQDVRDRMLDNEVLRLHKPLIINVPTRQEL